MTLFVVSVFGGAIGLFLVIFGGCFGFLDPEQMSVDAAEAYVGQSFSLVWWRKICFIVGGILVVLGGVGIWGYAQFCK